MRALVRKLLGYEQVRFLLVGLFNTFFGFLIYTLGIMVLGEKNYILALLIAQVIATSVAFVLHRRKVFQVKGSLWLDFFRFVGVNVVMYIYNLLVLPILVEKVHLQPIIAQFIITLSTIVISYLGHKYISFRRSKHEPEPHQ